MTTIINASNGSTSGLITTADASGVLQLQTNNGTPALTLNTTQALGVGSTPTYGTSGQVLTSAGSGAAPTWTTPSAGAMSLISTQTGSSVASLAWTGLSTYNTYLLIFELYVSSGQQIQLNTGTGSTPTYSTSGYKQNALAVNSASTTITNATNGAGYLLPAVGGIYFSGAPIASGYVYITNATSNNFINSAMYFLNTTPLRIYETSGGQTNDNAFTAIKLTSTSGNISGTASLYGISA